MEAPEVREGYPRFLSVPTRWMDNDVYGHVNNVVYYSYFDTVVNEYLIRSGVLDIERSQAIGLVDFHTERYQQQRPLGSSTILKFLLH